MAEEYLSFKESNCVNCYKCIRHCPVKSIQFTSHQAHVLPDECILCGECVKVCPQEAKQVRSDIDYVKDAIIRGKKVIATLAPSFVANYPGQNITSMNNTLHQLGFYETYETAIGASLIKEGYDELLKDKQSGVYITSCCPTVNLLITKYYPEVIPNLLPFLSPMEAHSLLIKEKHPDATVVFVGPCISKKKEAHDSKGLTDYTITFQELTNWLMDEEISFDNATNEFDEYGKSRIFPVSGGILASMRCDNPKFDYLYLDGVTNIMKVLEEIKNNEIENCFIEMSACVSGCIGGPGMDANRFGPISSYQKVKQYLPRKDFIVPEIDPLKLQKTFIPDKIKKSIPSDSIIESILIKMGKNSKKDELNCGSCGYDTCRDKAIALYQGKAELSMCLPYLKDKAESFTEGIISNTPNGILVLSEQLNIQLINKSALELLRVSRSSDVMNQNVMKILDISPYIDILESKENRPNARRYLAEYDVYVDETVIYDHKFHVIIIILRDVTMEERAKKHKDKLSKNTIEVADKIIEKQMKAVQEIASLLGESTAEVKVAISKLKESMNHE
ncbi:MAG: [Fe-Fe] hydrogenase large subunit C-terminal domain-containing protein [Candidatus Izemoplasmatales bacterium]